MITMALKSQHEFDLSLSTYNQRRAKQAAAPDVIDLDIETRSELDLRKVGAFKYATHPSTDIWCVAYSINGGPIQLWYPVDPLPFHKAPAKVRGHNVTFEFLLWMHVLHVRYDWPKISFEICDCTMVRALPLALPPKLENLAPALRLEHRKDPSSQRLMLLMARPAKPRRGQDPTRIRWHDDPDKVEGLGQRCMLDVEIEQEADGPLPPLSDAERKLWLLDFQINARGFKIDRKLAEAARRIVEQAAPEIDLELSQLTDGVVTAIGQVGRMLPWVQGEGFRGRSLQRDVIEQQLAENTTITDKGRRGLELRLGGAQAAAKKVDALLARAGPDDRVRGAFRFHGASTGRWSGEGFQPQNLKRPGVEDIEAAIAAVATGSLKRLKKLSNKPLSIIGDVIRPMIIAEDGHELVGADLSAIEARVLAFVAGESWLLDQYAKFDATGNPEHEPYRVIVAPVYSVRPNKITDAQRRIGKTATLAFGYMGGLNAWRNFSDECTDAEVLKIRDSWRKLHPNICKLWRALDRCAVGAVKHPGKVFRCGLVDLWSTGSFMFIELPNRRRLAYPFPSIVRNSFDQDAVSFYDASAGQFSPCRFGQGAFGGTWTENVVQAIARDILAEAMLRIDAAGHKIVLHVHDEIVVELPTGTLDPKQLIRLMTRKPRWALNLPLAAEGWRGKRYIKT